jgi:hypothetical protein
MTPKSDLYASGAVLTFLEGRIFRVAVPGDTFFIFRCHSKYNFYHIRQIYCVAST